LFIAGWLTLQVQGRLSTGWAEWTVVGSAQGGPGGPWSAQHRVDQWTVAGSAQGGPGGPWPTHYFPCWTLCTSIPTIAML